MALQSLKISMNLKNYHSTLRAKKLNDFKKRFNKLKAVNAQRDKNKVFKPKVLDNVEDLFNDLYYIYRNK